MRAGGHGEKGEIFLQGKFLIVIQYLMRLLYMHHIYD